MMPRKKPKKLRKLSENRDFGCSRGVFETQTHENAFITFEAEPAMEGGDCGGLRKVATHHNPS